MRLFFLTLPLISIVQTIKEQGIVKIFRRIRQRLLTENKVSRYLIYPFGEIILVMIGIILALQVNNWNENRNDKITEKGLVLNILENLKTDSLSFVRYLSQTKVIDSLQSQLHEIGVNGIQYDKLSNPSNIRRLPNLDPVTKKNDPFVADKKEHRNT